MNVDTGAWLERTFNEKLKRYEGGYSYKFPDYKVYSKMVAAFPEVALMIRRVPCDRLFVFKGRSYMFELKHTVLSYINIGRFKEHQIAHLLKHKQAGGFSFFVIGHLKDMYIIDVSVLVMLIKGTERKSLLVENLKRYSQSLDGVFDE